MVIPANSRPHHGVRRRHLLPARRPERRRASPPGGFRPVERHGRRIAPRRRVPTLGLAHPLRGGRGREGRRRRSDRVARRGRDLRRCQEPVVGGALPRRPTSRTPCGRRAGSSPGTGQPSSSTCLGSGSRIPASRPSSEMWSSTTFVRPRASTWCNSSASSTCSYRGAASSSAGAGASRAPSPGTRVAGLGHLTRAIVVPQVRGPTRASW
jgi:hypothetical protein